MCQQVDYAIDYIIKLNYTSSGRSAMILIRSLSFILFLFTCSFSQTTISGTVKDEATNAGLAKALVSLNSTWALVLTDQNGKFDFSTSAVKGKSNNRNIGSSDFFIHASGNIVSVSSQVRSGSLNVQVCDISGRRVPIHAVSASTNVRMVTFKTTDMADGLYLVICKAGLRQSIYRVQIIQGKALTFEFGRNQTATLANPMGKLTATSDILMVSKYGYYPKATPITGAPTNLSITLKKMPKDSIVPPGMKKIPAGTFMMGSTNGDAGETPVHQVTLSAFFMDSTEVTQADFVSLLKTKPWIGYDGVSGGQDSNSHPVWNIGWFDAVAYCNARSKRDGFDTVYSYKSLKGSLGNGCILDSTLTDYSKNGYRLPTESEWEYACRAGTTTDYYWGNQADSTINKYAWYRSNSGPTIRTLTTHRVALLLPNAFGLYDMSGNVWEYGNDYGDYPTIPQINPTIPLNARNKCIRGGCWTSFSGEIRSARRNIYDISINAGKFSFGGLRSMLPDK